MKSRKLAILLIAFAFSSVLQAAGQSRPNFLIIVTDDETREGFSETYMPRTFERIALQGANFTRAFVTTPLCCPSRASIFTGLLARHHGVVRNVGELRNTNFDHVARFPEELKKAGYFTGLVGKYLNFWKGTWRKNEFDYWVSYSVSELPDWFNYTLIKNRQQIKVRNEYITDKLLAYCTDFLNKAVASDKPFVLYFATTAPHGPAFPAHRHENLYPGLTFERPPSFNEFDLSEKPKWMQKKLPQLTDGEIRDMDLVHVRQLQSLAAVDEAVDSLMSFLDSHGILNQTMIIFLSDNSVFYGEHRLRHKGLFYEEAVRIPLAIRYPPFISINEPIVSTKLVANIDLAPTIYEVAGLVPPKMDGASLVPLLKNQKTHWRKNLLIEGWPDAPGGVLACSPPFTAIHTSRYVYSETYANNNTGAKCTFGSPDTPELYDLKFDPYQIQNANSDPKYEAIRKELKKRLDEYGYVAFPRHRRH